MNIAEVIRKYRKEAGLTQEEMANRLGVTTPAVNKWENGNSKPDIELLAPIARLLHISLDTLLSFKEDLTPTEIDEIIQKMDSMFNEVEFEKVFEWATEKIKEYPNCRSALQWWCNSRKNNVLLGIVRNKGLKEFMINNNPKFSISNKCCKYAKKDILKDLLKQGYDLNISGIRKSEGRVRSTAYKSCFDTQYNYDNYRPIFWFTDNDKLEYRKLFNVNNSKCYTVYGLKRTGCVGCPFGKNYKEELEIIKKYEPKLYKAVTNLFKDSYEYINNYKGE